MTSSVHDRLYNHIPVYQLHHHIPPTMPQQYHHHSHPKKPRHPLESLVGSKLLRSVTSNSDRDPLAYNFHQSFREGPTVATREALADKDLVLIYFGAGWSLSCREFTNYLDEFYQQVICRNQEHNNHKDDDAPSSLEVIYVSHDRDVREFQTTYSQMPWLAVDFESSHYRNVLTRQLHASKIPLVVVLDGKTGYYVTDQACDDVVQAIHDGSYCHTNANKNMIVRHFAIAGLLHKWKQAEAVPLSEATFSSGTGCVIL